MSDPASTPESYTISGVYAAPATLKSAPDELSGLNDLPDRAAAAYLLATDVLAQIDRASADEPWTLIGDGPPPSMARLREIVDRLRVIIGEAGARGAKASQLAPGLVKSSRQNNALRALSLSIAPQIDGRLKALNDALEAVALKRGCRARAASRLVGDIGGPWPYAEVLVVVMLERIEDWFNTLAELAEPLRDACSRGRRITIVPAVLDLSVPDQAISGVETLLPQPFSDIAWLKALGFPPIDSRLTRIFDMFSAALLEASAIDAFECAREGRAPEEAIALARAHTEIESAWAEIERCIPAAQRMEMISHVHHLRAMGPNLGREFGRSVHGATASQAVVTLIAMKLIFVDADIRDMVGRSERIRP